VDKSALLLMANNEIVLTDRGGEIELARDVVAG
jgi:hypothetical protein